MKAVADRKTGWESRPTRGELREAAPGVSYSSWERSGVRQTLLEAFRRRAPCVGIRSRPLCQEREMTADSSAAKPSTSVSNDAYWQLLALRGGDGITNPDGWAAYQLALAREELARIEPLMPAPRPTVGK